MKVNNSNINFGAIKIEAPKKVLKDLPKTGKSIGTNANIAETYWGKRYVAIETQQYTERENFIIDKLKEVFKDNKKVKITSHTDKKSAPDVDRFNDLRYGSKRLDNPLSIKNIHNNVGEWMSNQAS